MNDLKDKLAGVVPYELQDVEEKISIDDVEDFYQSDFEIAFHESASIELNFIAKELNQYKMPIREFERMVDDLRSSEFIEIGHLPHTESGQDAILITINHYTLFCSTQKDSVLFVYRIESYSAVKVDNVVSIKNIFDMYCGTPKMKKPNPHLRYLYYKLIDTPKLKDENIPIIWNIRRCSIPLVLNSQEIRTEDIYYFQEYLKSMEYIEIQPTDENKLHLYLNGYKVKALFSGYKNHLYIFNITLAREIQSSFYIQSSVFKIAESQENVDNHQEDENIIKLHKELFKDAQPLKKVERIENCFPNNPKDGSIELNFEPPKHHIDVVDKKIIQIRNEETVKLYRMKSNRTKAIILTSSLKIDCLIHRTNLDVKYTQMFDDIKKIDLPSLQEYQLCIVKGSIFHISKGDQSRKRRDNPHLVNFLTRAKKDVQKTPVPVTKTVQNTVTPYSYNFKNIILSGVAGVGKTYSYVKLINMIDSGVNELELFDKLKSSQNFDEVVQANRIEFITFHQNYSYEEFIEGIKLNSNGTIKIEDGLFKSFVEKAIDNPKQKFYFIIDEINRGNISKIFGELITLIEDSKRGNLFVTLPYSKEKFTIPENLFIIGTMNITDQSISKIDIALRRRFLFAKISPNSILVCEEFRERYETLNKFISEELGEDYLIGHSYFMNCNSSNLDFILKYQIQPLLEDYFYGDPEKLDNSLKIIEL